MSFLKKAKNLVRAAAKGSSIAQTAVRATVRAAAAGDPTGLASLGVMAASVVPVKALGEEAARELVKRASKGLVKDPRYLAILAAQPQLIGTRTAARLAMKAYGIAPAIPAASLLRGAPAEVREAARAADPFLPGIAAANPAAGATLLVARNLPDLPGMLCTFHPHKRARPRRLQRRRPKYRVRTAAMTRKPRKPSPSSSAPRLSAAERTAPLFPAGQLGLPWAQPTDAHGPRSRHAWTRERLEDGSKVSACKLCGLSRKRGANPNGGRWCLYDGRDRPAGPCIARTEGALR